MLFGTSPISRILLLFYHIVFVWSNVIAAGQVGQFWSAASRLAVTAQSLSALAPTATTVIALETTHPDNGYVKCFAPAEAPALNSSHCDSLALRLFAMHRSYVTAPGHKGWHFRFETCHLQLSPGHKIRSVTTETMGRSIQLIKQECGQGRRRRSFGGEIDIHHEQAKLELYTGPLEEPTAYR